MMTKTTVYVCDGCERTYGHDPRRHHGPDGRICKGEVERVKYTRIDAPDRGALLEALESGSE